MALSTARTRRLSTLRQRINDYRALRVFSRAYDSAARRDFDRMLDGIADLTNRSLSDLEPGIETDIATIESSLKPRRPLAYYTELIANSGVPPGSLLFVPKWELKLFFAGIEGVLLGLERHPEHTLVSFDVYGAFPPGTKGEVRILEAALFEDMCALYNRAAELQEIVAAPNASKPRLKESAAVRRATILAAFYTVEAYLNSIAFDFLVTRGNEAASAELERLTEWDQARNRERLVNFREKLLSYPKIIMRAQHPPLQESNCEEMRFLFEESKQFRDAIVHANPRPDPERHEKQKELLFWQIGSVTPVSAGRGKHRQSGEEALGLWAKTVDSAIVLIQKIEMVTHGNTDRLFWLQHRGANGRFDATVFD